VTKSGITWRVGARLSALLIALGVLAAGATVAGAGASIAIPTATGQIPIGHGP
jgi:hypothetical protein